MIADIFFLLVCLLTGAGAGVVFFEGLWRTVLNAASSARPAAWFMLSYAVRTTLFLLLLWFVSHSNVFRMAACMAGFLVGRTIILRLRRGGRFAN